MKKQYLILGLLLASFQFAQAQFTLSGEFRPRTEYFGAGGPQTAGVTLANGKDRQGAPGGTTAIAGDEGYVSTSVRAAINAMYKSEGYDLYIGFQEVFLFGDRTQIQKSGNGNFRVQEAWADIKLGEFSSLKLGRQPLSYDDQRILGGLAWAQQARTHDAAVFKYKKEGYSLDIGASLNTFADEVYNSASLFSYRDMTFVRANKKFDALNLTFLGLVNTFQDNKTKNNVNGTPTDPSDDFNSWGEDKNSLITAGLHADYTAGAVKLSANAFLQDGQRIGGTEVKGAYLGSLDAVVKASDKISILGGGEIISGKTEDSAAFFPLYGTNHKFNGLIDRFYVGNHANNEGLIDLNLGLSTKLAGYGVTLKYHNFSGESDLGNGMGRDNLGSEIDLVVKKKFKGFMFVGGASVFNEGDNAPANAKDFQGWAWAMLVFKPKFL